MDPIRTDTNRRLYTDDDVERLLLLGQVTRAGRRIGDVAALSADELRSMVNDDREAAAQASVLPARPTPTTTADSYLATCLQAIVDLDAEALDTALGRASIELSIPALTEQLLEPLMQEIGDQWKNGSLRVAHEHMATALVRSFLGTLRNGRSAALEGAPEIVVATPAGQNHELGAMMVAIAASSDGWRVTYLGANLPAEEIATVAVTRRARAVGLSIVYPGDDPRLPKELRTLRDGVGADVTLLAGGASAVAYQKTLQTIDARLVPDVATLREELQILRQAPRSD